MTEQTQPRPADAVKGNWVDRFPPRAFRPYLRLTRFDRPIGAWLLLWPCWWSLALAAPRRPTGVASLSGLETGPFPDPLLLGLFLIGAFIMRGAGCTYNDILDRDIDAGVARTRGRPIPSGQVTVRAAVLWMVLQALIGLAVLLTFNPFAVAVGVASLAIVAVYPLMKRVTNWPQFVLGLAFNWGALLGWAAATGRLDPAPVLLYLGGICWTLGYDTIYAHQDRADDSPLGVKSTALTLGRSTTRWLWGFYGVMITAFGAAGWLAEAGPLLYGGLTIAAGHAVWQINTLDIDSPADCLAKFKSNHRFGLIVFLSIIAGSLYP
ncbi:MAG: 4-hydroxybenzoate octaprenyltransferase [Sphingomonadales bacterium]